MNSFATGVRRGLLIVGFAVAILGVNRGIARADCQTPEVGNLVAALNQKARYLAEEIQFASAGSPQSEFLQQDAGDLFSAAQGLSALLENDAPVPQLLPQLNLVEAARQHILHVLQQAGSTPAVDCNLREIELLIANLAPHWNPNLVVPGCTIPQAVPQQIPQPGVSFNMIPPGGLQPGLALRAHGKHFAGPHLVGQNFVGRPPFAHAVAVNNGWRNLPAAGPGQQMTLQLGNMRLGFVTPGR